MTHYPIRRHGYRRTLSLALLSTFAVAGALVTAPAQASSRTTSASTTAPEATATTPAASAVPTPSGEKPKSDGPAPAGKSQSLTFGIRPYLAKGGQPRGSFLFRASPGQTVHDEVSVFNYADVPLVFEVYVTDATTSSDGGFGLLDRAHKPKDVGTWVTLVTPASGGIRVQPHVRVDIPFSVVVPDSAGPGDHVGGIVVSLPGKQVDANGNAVRVDSRVSSLLSFRVSGEIRPGLSVSDLKSGYATSWRPWSPGRGRVSFKIHNLGNISQGATYDVTFHSPLGLDMVVPQGKIPGILPGDSLDVNVDAPDLWPAFRYTATVNVHGLPTAGDPVAPPISAGASFWASPIPQLLVLLGLVFLVRLMVWLRQRRKGKQARVIAAAVEASHVPAEPAGVAS